ncbi:MAG: tetratricopeptide repeat protein [Deltaproteobacteria bacterium]|nr:tetratricopeptide repeat protein [Deltaproteobacteria bacterium]
MKKFNYHDFSPQEAWLLFRLDTQVAEKSADVYMLMELSGGDLIASEATLDEGLTPQQLQSLLNQAHNKKAYWPKTLLLTKGDPVVHSFAKLPLPAGMALSPHPASAFEELIVPVKESFGEFCYSPSSLFYSHAKDDVHPEDIEAARQSLPDAYDPCPCASGKKYKFCCKPIFREISGAMTAAEEGRKQAALKYIQEAKKRAGETAEVLCREAIVYSFFDEAEFKRLLERCLERFPEHPRANYIMGLHCREQRRFQKAVTFYAKAIENYPRTDRFHLNEVYNNIGTVYYELSKYQEAKEAWEQALFLLPSDRTVKGNLIECIYSNPDVPEPLRKVGPLVARFFEK